MTNNNTNDTTSTMPTTGTAAPTSSATGALPRELVFIDATVPDVAVLVANVRPDVAVVLLNSASDPWQQMTAAISQYQELTAVHLVSHGQAGALVLNGQSYDSTSILAEKELLASWSAHLAVGADVLLYGCDVAAGDAGGSLLSALSRLTLTDVAASTNLTGASAAGGDWVLEQSTGAIQATSPFTSAIAQDYTQLLVSGIYSSTTGTNVDTAGVTSGLIGAGKLITFNPITVTATDPAAKLVIRAYDVDYGLKTAAGVPYAAGDANSEWDGVYIQKAGASSWTFVGYLNGTNNNWSYSTFDVSSIVNSTGDWLVRVVPDDNGTQTQTSNGGKWVVGTSIAEFFMGSGSLISSLTESGQSVTSQWNAPVGNYTIQYLLLDASGRAVAQVNSATSEIVANATQTNSTTLAVNTNFYSSWAAVPTGTYTLQATLIDAAGVVQDVKTISTPITGATSGSGTSSSSSSTTTNSSSGTNYTTITGNTSWTGSTAADLAHTATSDTTPTLTGYVYASSSSSSARTVNIYMDGVLLGSTTSSTTYDSTHHAYAWTFTPTTAISLGAHTFTASRSGGNYVQSSPYALTIDTAVTPAITGLTTASWTGSTIADLASQSNHAATPHTTGDKTPGIVGTAGPLTSLAIYDGATLLGYTTSDASGAWTFQVGDLLPLANGSHSFTAKDTSSTLTSSAFALAIDSTAPTQTISIASISADTGVSGDFITSVATQTINATLNSALLAGQRLLGSLDGGVTWIDATTAVSGTSIAWAGRTLKTGYADPTQLVAWAIEFKVVDSANQNGPIAAQDYQLIQSGGTPVITTIAASSASSVTTNFVRPVVTGTADPNTVVDIYAGTTLLGSAAVNASGNWTFSPVNNISSGTYTIKAIERDALTGYVSPDSGTKTLVINTTLPLLTLNTASDSGTYNSDAITSASTPSVHVDFSSLVNSGVGIVAGDTVQILKAGVQIGSATALTSTNVTNKYIDIATAALGSDANVTLTAKIVHGGVPYASNDLGVTLDTTAPVFASGTIDGSSVVLHYTEGVGLDPNAPTLSQFSVSIGGTATVPDSLIFDPVAKTVTLLLPSAATSTSTATVSYTPAASPSVKLLDLAGNAAVALNAQTLTNITDTTPPTLSSISPQNPASPTNADAVTFRVTFADASGGVSSVDANDFVAKLNGTAVAIAAVTQVSGLVYDVLVNDPAIAQANGNLVLSLATQTAGMYITDVSQAANLLANDTSRAGTYVLDNTAPSALSITSVTDDVGSITGALSNPGRTDDNNLLVRVNLTGSGAVAGDSVQLYAGSDTSSPLGSAYVLSSTDITHVYADLSTGTLENGITYTITARVADALGNQSVVSTNSFVETVDTTITNPVVSLTNDTTDGLSTHNTDLKSSSAVLTFNTKDADASRTFVVDSGNASGTYTAPTSQGPHTVTVTDLDTAGNTAGASITFTLDSVAPALNSATVHGNTLVLSYNEDGAGLSALSPSTGDFAITKGLGHDPVGVSSVAVDTLHKTLTLSLTSAIAITDSNILVSYTPGANPIGDIAGNTAAALVAQSVTNLTANTVSIGDVTVSESSPFAVFQLNLEAPAGGTVVFTPTLSSSGGAGYATLGTDTGSVLQYFNASSWTDVSGPIILASGTSHALFRVAISNDNVFEGRESFTFNTGSITGSANISNSTGASATGTIADDGSSANIFLSNNNTATPTTGIADSDLPVISVSSVTVSESQPYAMVSVSLSNSSTSAVSFTPVLSGGTTSGLATIGTDTGSSIEYFNGTSWQDATQGVVIAAGVQSIQLRVSIVQDALYNEGTETFTVSTGSITAGAVSNAAGASGIVSITDVSALRDPVITDVLETNTDPTPYDLLTAQTLQVVTLTGESGCTVTLFRLNDNTHDPVAVIAPGFTTAEAAGSSLSTYTLDFHANSLPAGEYEVRLSKNGYSSHYSNSFTIDSTPGLYDITGQRANVKISDAITVTNGAVGGMDQNRMPGHWNGTDWLDSDGQTIRFSQDALITFVQGSAPADSVVMTTASSGSTLALHTETGAYTYTPSATAINTGALDTFTLFASDGGKGASLPLTFDPKDSLDRDGIPALVETQLGNLAGASGDMNHDGILDANQNAVATLAWTTVDQYTAAINGTLSSAAPVISVVVAQSTSGSAVDASSQLADVKVLDPQSAVVGGSKPANATWDPIQFTVAPLQSMGLQDADPSRPGTQVRILIDVSQDNLPASSFNGYMKYVNQAAVTAGVSDLVGNQITTPGWYDFTQRVSGGDGARFITSGGVLTAIELTITDNAFGDDNPVIGQIFDPGVPVNNVPAPPAPPAPPLLNTPPPPPAVPTVLSQVTNNTHPLISGTASLAMGETLTVTVNGAIYTNVPVTAGGWSLNLASATPSSGVLGTFVDGQVYSVTATALAIAGGTSTDTTSNELTIDTTPPVVPTVNSQITSNTHPTITGTATLATGETLTVTVNGATFANVPVTSGLWSLNTATVKPTNGVLGGFVDGHVYSVTATASDVAGNTSTDRSSSELIIDTSSPVVPTVSSQTTSNTHPVITGTAALGSGETLTVTVNGATYTNVPVISGSWSLNTGTAIPASGALGSFVAGHVYSVIATALDAAGNTSTDTTNNELTLSNPTQPVYALLLPSGDRWLTSSAADAHQLGQMLHSGKAEVDFYVSSQVMPNALELKAWHNVVTGDYLYLPASVALPYSCYQPTSDTTLGYVMAPGKGAFDVHLYLNAWGVTQLMGQGQATQLGLLSQGYMDVGAVFSSLPADDSVQPVTLVGQTVVV
jgi:hypothetical protein